VAPYGLAHAYHKQKFLTGWKLRLLYKLRALQVMCNVVTVNKYLGIEFDKHFQGKNSYLLNGLKGDAFSPMLCYYFFFLQYVIREVQTNQNILN